MGMDGAGVLLGGWKVANGVRGALCVCLFVYHAGGAMFAWCVEIVLKYAQMGGILARGWALEEVGAAV